MGLFRTIFTRPSERTQYEATLTGLTILLITSLLTSVYICFFTDMNIFLKILSGLGGIGIFLFTFSNLSLTYLQYYTFKNSMGMYSVDKKLLMKLEDGKKLVKEIEKLMKENELIINNQKEVKKC